MNVAGMGFRAAATLADLRAALALAEARGGPADALATVPAKAAAPVLVGLAAERRLPVIAVPVAGIATPTQSPHSLAAHATGSVAEASALAAAGPGARLVATRVIAPSGRATCALACRPFPSVPDGGGSVPQPRKSP